MASSVTATYLKKGKPEDIILEIDENAQKLTFFQKFLDFGLEENFIFRFIPMKSKNQINFYLSTTKNKRKKAPLFQSTSQNDEKARQKKLEKEKEKEKMNKGLESILFKYVPSSQTENPKPVHLEEPQPENDNTLQSKQRVVTQSELNENYTLKMRMIVVDQEIFANFYDKDLEKINIELQNFKPKSPEVKHFLLLQGVGDFFSSSSFKRKIKKNLTTSPNQPQDAASNSEEDFYEWLADVTVIHDFEYQLTETANDSIEFLKRVIEALILKKFKNLEINALTKESTHSEKSKISGFDNQFSLMWIDILMAIPRISEDKAIAIVKNYPTLRSLMKMIDESENDEMAENQLKNMQIYYNYNQTKTKNLGGAMASQIIKAFKELDPTKTTIE